MASGRLYQTIFSLSYLVNFVLFLLVSYVLVKTLVAPTDSSQQEFSDLAVVIAFSIFILCFVCFSVAYIVFLLRKTYITVVLVVVFMVGQALCVLITALTLFSRDDVNERKSFSEDPVTWIITRRWIPIAFALVFLPLLAAQIFLVNRYANQLGLGASATSGDGKAPYQPGEQLYVREE